MRSRCSGLACFVPIDRLPARHGDHSGGSARQIGQQLPFSTTGPPPMKSSRRATLVRWSRWSFGIRSASRCHSEVPFIGPFAGGLVVSDREYLQAWGGLTLTSERSAALKTERRLPATASFNQRRRQVRLAYPQRPRVVRLWNVSIRSAGQQPSRAEHGKWKVEHRGCKSDPLA
jgi:hypothetical protein